MNGDVYMKVYFETTTYNWYIDVDRPYHNEMVEFFNSIPIGGIEPFTSDEVIRELNRTR